MERMDALLYDCDIREPLFDYLEERFGKARMFEEKIIGKSRADVLMVTEGRITGLEIKSDADTYERLKRQIRDYDKYCDENYVVIGRSHAKHVEEHIPAYWGVLVVSVNGREIVIEEMRPAAAEGTLRFPRTEPPYIPVLPVTAASSHKRSSEPARSPFYSGTPHWPH